MVFRVRKVFGTFEKRAPGWPILSGENVMGLLKVYEAYQGERRMYSDENSHLIVFAALMGIHFCSLKIMFLEVESCQKHVSRAKIRHREYLPTTS